MGLFSSPIKTLDDLFIHTLQDIYYAENQIAKNLPTMVEKAGSSELKGAFQKHLTETKNHIKRLEQRHRLGRRRNLVGQLLPCATHRIPPRGRPAVRQRA